MPLWTCRKNVCGEVFGCFEISSIIRFILVIDMDDNFFLKNVAKVEFIVQRNCTLFRRLMRLFFVCFFKKILINSFTLSFLMKSFGVFDTNIYRKFWTYIYFNLFGFLTAVKVCKRKINKRASCKSWGIFHIRKIRVVK